MKLAAVVFLIGIFAKDLNGASFSAMDVIVVEQPDGSFKSSPFYVQFDKAMIQKSRTKTIKMKVNGRPRNVNMDLDRNGKASFARESAAYENVYYNVQTDQRKFHMSSQLITSLDLVYGMNKINFYLGDSAKCKCNVFLWNHNDTIVVSDIDVVIEKPESLATKYLPFVENERIQPNVANFFGKIERNGYKFLYLSSRPITKFEETRNLMRNVQQNGDWIPYGPIILNPTSDSLLSKLTSRYDFKTSCLFDIGALFPEYPFHSGFGQKESPGIGRSNGFDVYKPVGIKKIFTTDASGRVTCGYAWNDYADTTYERLSCKVDEYFPPLFDGELPPSYSEM